MQHLLPKLVVSAMIPQLLAYMPQHQLLGGAGGDRGMHTGCLGVYCLSPSQYK